MCTWELSPRRCLLQTALESACQICPGWGYNYQNTIFWTFLSLRTLMLKAHQTQLFCTTYLRYKSIMK